MTQNHIWLVERRYRDASYSAVVIAANKADAIAMCGMVNATWFKVTNIGTASKDRQAGVVVADIHAEDDDEEYSISRSGEEKEGGRAGNRKQEDCESA